MSKRGAFTLIETLLALGLSSGLLLVVFNLVNSTAHYHLTSHDQIMSSQRLIGLMQDLRYDVHLVQADRAWSAPKVVSKSVDEVVLEDQVLPRTATELRVQSLEAFASPIHLFGTRDALLLTIAPVNPRFERPTILSANQSERTSPLYQQVLWTHARSLPLTLPTRVAGGTLVSQTFNRQALDGLLRMEMIPASPGRGSLSDGVAQVIACDSVANASHVKFRYFDGSSWSDGWNSSDKESLPVSIEVSFEDASGQGVHQWIISLMQSVARSTTASAQEVRP